MGRDSVYQQVTDRIVAAIEAGGTAPWRKPWRSSGGYPISIRSGKPYRGVNVLLLALGDYADPRWGTYRALQEVGGQVRKGEKATNIILWKPAKTREQKNEESGEMERGQYLLLRSYAVFNALQADGVPDLPVEEKREFTPIEQAEKIVDDYVWKEGPGINETTGPHVEHGFDRAYYNLTKDVVRMPSPEQFFSDESYYVTLFHELAHSTGHQSRLGRIEPALFGSDPYAKEELVAEIGASFLSGMAGFDSGEDQSAAYVKGWLEPLGNDPKFIVQAAAQAQKAADCIIGIPVHDSGIPEKEIVTA